MAKVFHIDNTLIAQCYSPAFQPKIENYRLVAEVDSEDLEHIFRLTNHIENDWWENEGIKVIEKSRSTSVGDMVELSNGKRFICKFVGWEEFQ